MQKDLYADEANLSLDLVVCSNLGKSVFFVDVPVGNSASAPFRPTQSMSCILHVGCEENHLCIILLTHIMV